MKILITGAPGFIGRHLVEFWSNHGHSLVALSRNIDPALFPANVGCINADISVEEDIQAAIIMVAPDVIVHLAASSKPNNCELDQQACHLVNVDGTRFIVDACKALGARLIFLSTDFVFGHNGPFSETDVCAPVNYYGQSKLLAEELVIRSGIPAAIVRTVMVIGKKLPGQGNTFLHWVLQNLGEGKPIKVFTDQLRSITYVDDLCRGLNSIVRKQAPGIFHICGSEALTPYELAVKIADIAGYDSGLISPVTRATFPEAAMRPQNSVLMIDKAREHLGFEPTPLEDMLGAIILAP